MTKKISRNILRWSVLGISLTSILFSLLLVYSPTAGAFGGSTANCPGGGKVSCSGYKCTATDNVGCSCVDENGKQGDKQSCTGHEGDDGFAMLEELDY